MKCYIIEQSENKVLQFLFPSLTINQCRLLSPPKVSKPLTERLRHAVAAAANTKSMGASTQASGGTF